VDGPPPRAPTAPASPREERRWVSVLFADLSGFTSMSERMDPDELANALLTTVGLAILGVPSIAMLAVIVFVCGFVPVLGPF